jgi:hypothetical protein
VAAAAAWGKEVVELMIKSGAEVNMQLQAGRYGSALAAAAPRHYKGVVKLLINSGAEVNAQLQAGEYGSALTAAVATRAPNESSNNSTSTNMVEFESNSNMSFLIRLIRRINSTIFVFDSTIRRILEANI